MYNSYALSSYLAFRFVYNGEPWKQNLSPYNPKINDLSQHLVDSSDDIIHSIRKIIKKLNLNKTTLLLSGGIDSAIIASFLPKGTKVYTIRFIAKDAIDETDIASLYAKSYHLKHEIISISFKEYINSMNILIDSKKSPLHPIEPALYIASQKIKKDGFKNILTGCNADGTFGGLDNLLSKDWSLKEFIDRYTFVDYKYVLKDWESMDFVYKKYCENKYIDTVKFIKEIFGFDTYLAFSNGINTGGCNLIAPFAYLKLKSKLDLSRIRRGESKYLIKEVFQKRYQNFNEIPHKIAFARPMDQWLSSWTGPKRKEFKKNINLKKYSGNQKWLIYCLEYFLNYFDN